MLCRFNRLILNEYIRFFGIHALHIYKSKILNIYKSMITVIGLFQEPSWVFTNKEKCTAFTNLPCVIHENQCFKKIILSQMETTGFMNNGNDINFFKYIYTNVNLLYIYVKQIHMCCFNVKDKK